MVARAAPWFRSIRVGVSAMLWALRPKVLPSFPDEKRRQRRGAFRLAARWRRLRPATQVAGFQLPERTPARIFLRWSSRRRLPLFRSATHAGSSEDWRGTAEAFTFVWFLRSVIGSMGPVHRHTALLGEDHMEQDFDARSQLSHGPLLVVPETIPQSSFQYFSGAALG